MKLMILFTATFLSLNSRNLYLYALKIHVENQLDYVCTNAKQRSLEAPKRIWWKLSPGLYDQIQFVFEYWIDKESSSGSKNPRVVY